MGFNKKFKCVSGVMVGKDDIDKGGKANLPHECLEELARMKITYPMTFRVTNPQTGLSTHCGVLEFTAPTDTIVAPYWLMEHLGVPQNGMLQIENTSLKRGTYIKIQPQQKAFIELANPKAVLESRMKSYSCLTKGDMISIYYQGRSYYLAILECRVGSEDVEAISIVEANVNVDFARPADMPPSPQHKPAAAPTALPSSAGAPSQGVTFGNTLLDRDPSGNNAAPKAGSSTAPHPDAAKQFESPSGSTGFVAFKGAGRSLNGSSASTAASGSGAGVGAGAGAGVGIGVDSLGRPLKKTTEVAEKKEFKAFSGAGRSLK